MSLDLKESQNLTDEDDPASCEVRYSIDEQILVQQQVVRVWPPLPYCYSSCLECMMPTRNGNKIHFINFLSGKRKKVLFCKEKCVAKQAKHHQQRSEREKGRKNFLGCAWKKVLWKRLTWKSRKFTWLSSICRDKRPQMAIFVGNYGCRFEKN